MAINDQVCHIHQTCDLLGFFVISGFLSRIFLMSRICQTFPKSGQILSLPVKPFQLQGSLRKTSIQRQRGGPQDLWRLCDDFVDVLFSFSLSRISTTLHLDFLQPTNLQHARHNVKGMFTE